MFPPTVIRTCEWSEVPSGLSGAQRLAIQAAADQWQLMAGLNEAPVWFTGADGSLLCTSQHVGVLEVDGCTVEILPKLDAGTDRITSPDTGTTGKVMQNLLWMLSSCNYLDLTETDRANLQHDEIRYYDLFAFILAKRLLFQLQAGIPHAYVSQTDDLRALRGTLNIGNQVTRNWNRFDRLSCTWDEFTPDTALNRVFKSACRLLRRRVVNRAVINLLEECLVYLDDVMPLDARSALQTAQAIRWDRANDRFRPAFDLAVHLLSGEGFQLMNSSTRTFVFLLDMNKVFEAFAGAVLERTFNCQIDQQAEIGHLLVEPKRIKQIPDYLWRDGDVDWIGDAKYKRLDSRYYLESIFEDDENVFSPARIGPADLRQLTVYAEIQRQCNHQEAPPNLMVLFPFVGTQNFQITQLTTWNGSELHLVPIRLDVQMKLAQCIPRFVFNGKHLGGRNT
jgi:5-methylcytosine-specific restriction enzyme subunit McrC